jgi:hypothetical protein
MQPDDDDLPWLIEDRNPANCRDRRIDIVNGEGGTFHHVMKFLLEAFADGREGR